MATPNFRPTRKEAIAAVVEALHARELATSAEEYNAKTSRVIQDIERIRCPTDKEFKERADRGRAPWIRVIERALSDVKNGSFKFPHWEEQIDGDIYLIVRTTHIVEHIDLTWGAAPRLSKLTLKRQLHSAGLLLLDDDSRPRVLERSVAGKDGRKSTRLGHLNALLLWKVKMFCEGGSQ